MATDAERGEGVSAEKEHLLDDEKQDVYGCKGARSVGAWTIAVCGFLGVLALLQHAKFFGAIRGPVAVPVEPEPERAEAAEPVRALSLKDFQAPLAQAREQQHRDVRASARAHSEAPASEVQVEKALGDERTYAYHTLPSGLRVLLINDPKADKAAYALAVEAGSYNNPEKAGDEDNFDDPDNTPGLAHFLEHMLFLGTETYPDPGAYETWIHSHGGEENAYTAAMKTVYYAGLDESGLDGALDRFSGFFREPIIMAKEPPQELEEKEKQAVDHEWIRDKSDPWERMYLVMSEVAQKGSRNHKFSVGTKELLHAKDKQLQKFYRDYYCPDRMHLVVISKAQSVEQLYTVVNSKFEQHGFARQCAQEREPLAKEPYPTTGEAYVLETIGHDTLALRFQLPAKVWQRYEAGIDGLLEQLLAHRYEHGLHHRLVELGLAHSVSASVDGAAHLPEWADEPTACGLYVQMTEAGGENPKAVLQIVRQYLDFVRSLSAEQVREVYTSLQDQAAVEWQFAEGRGRAEGSSLARDLAATLVGVKPQHVRSAGELITPDMDLAQEAITSLDLEQAMVTLMLTKRTIEHDKHDESAIGAKAFDREERFAKVPFRQLAREELVGPALEDGDLRERLPHERQNPWALPVVTKTPQDLGLQVEEEREVPEQLEPGLWWLGFGPKPFPGGTLELKLCRPGYFSTPEQQVLAELYSVMLTRLLVAHTAVYHDGGVKEGIGFSAGCFFLTVSGYSQYAEELMRQVLKEMLAPEGSQLHPSHVNLSHWLTDARALLLKALDTEDPIGAAMGAKSAWLVENEPLREERKSAIESATVEQIIGLAQSLQDKHTELEMLVSGNFDKPVAKKIFLHAMQQIHAKPGAGAPQRYRHREEEVALLVPNPKKGDDNNVVILDWRLDKYPTMQERAALSILASYARLTSYQELRTRQQLGYAVGAMKAGLYGGPHGLVVYVEGTNTTDVIENAILGYLPSIETGLRTLTEEEFRRWRDGALNTLKHQDKTTAERHARLFGFIKEQWPCFRLREQVLAALERTTQDDVADLARNLLAQPKMTLTLLAGPTCTGFGAHKAPCEQIADPAACTGTCSPVGTLTKAKVQESPNFYPPWWTGAPQCPEGSGGAHGAAKHHREIKPSDAVSTSLVES